MVVKLLSESLWFLLSTTKKVLAYLKYKYFVHELEVRVYRLTNGEDSSITKRNLCTFMKSKNTTTTLIHLLLPML